MNKEVEQLRLECQKLCQENNELTKKHTELKPIILKFTTHNWDLSEENKKLKITNVGLHKKNEKLNADNTVLTEANLRLSKQVQRLAEDEDKARAMLRLNTSQLAQDLKDAEEDAENRVSSVEKRLRENQFEMGLVEPLIQIGVAVRLRFWEQAKETRGLGRANRAIVKAGNEAAHRGNIEADTALFQLGHIESIIYTWPLDSQALVTEDLNANAETELSPIEDADTDDWETMKEDLESRTRSLEGLYQTLYRVQGVYSLDTLLYDTLPRMKEIWNMFATLASCFRKFDPGNKGRNMDHVRFGELVIDCKRRYEQARSSFETSTEVMEKLHEMQKIVDKSVQNKLDWDRRRTRGT